MNKRITETEIADYDTEASIIAADEMEYLDDDNADDYADYYACTH